MTNITNTISLTIIGWLGWGACINISSSSSVSGGGGLGGGILLPGKGGRGGTTSIHIMNKYIIS